MPHQPRSFAPMSGESPLDSQRPTTARPEGQERRAADKPERQKPLVEKLSLRTYEPDPEAVVRALFGKEVETDARTGELVPPER